MVALVCLLAVFALAACEVPNGVHLALTGITGEMRAMWSLPSTPVSAGVTGQCWYGSSAVSLNQSTAVGAAYTYSAGGFNGSLYDVVMTGLKPDTAYFYMCGNRTLGVSVVFQFTSPSLTEVSFVVWGDMG